MAEQIARAAAPLRPRPPLRLALALLVVLVGSGALVYSARRDRVIAERSEKARAFVETVAQDFERRLMTSREDVLFLSSLDDAKEALASRERRGELERTLASFLMSRPTTT